MHRAGYVGGGVALRSVVSHRGCGAGPGRSLVCWPVPPSAGHPGGCVVLVVVSVVVCNGLAVHAEEPPPFWWGGSSADPRWWSSVLRGSSPGGVLPVDAREGVDRASPIGLEQVARASAGFEGAPHQRQHGAALASHCRLGPGFHRKPRSWNWSETGAGQRKKPPLGGGSSKTATELSSLTRMPPGPGDPVWRTKRCHRSAR
jgi:hypothetical protein